MVTVDSTSRFLAQIRSKITVAARRSPVGKRVPARDTRGTVPQRILSIDPQDPDRRLKAFRVFLETVILDEFGVDLLNDPELHRIIDSVHESMQQDMSLRSAIDKAGEFLLESARGSSAQ